MPQHGPVAAPDGDRVHARRGVFRRAESFWLREAVRENGAAAAADALQLHGIRQSRRSSVRLPKDVAFGDDVELVLVRSGNVMTIYPAAISIPEMLEALRNTPAPSAIERRDEAPLADRPGF